MSAHPLFRPVRAAALAAALVVLCGLLTVTSAGPASAATRLSAPVLRLSVGAEKVRATVRVRSSQPMSARRVGVCARRVGGGRVDFPTAWRKPDASGVRVRTSRRLADGRYRVWACVGRGGTLRRVGERTALVVGAGGRRAADHGAAAPVGNLRHWRQVFVDDFRKGAGEGTFLRRYGRWSAYDGFNDTFNGATYDADRLSARRGLMRMRLGTEDGVARASAPAPVIGSPWQGQTYGRWSVRFRAPAIDGWKTAWLLWPDSDNWNEGEIDWPEGPLDGRISGFVHCLGNPTENCGYVHTSRRFNRWHVATIEWTPQHVDLILDGRRVERTTNAVPTTPMHWVLQTESDGGTPPSGSSGRVLIDWVSVYRYRG
ncbi:glycoside hydrolase family 16 protein [Nocardioides bruguierae]|uniref:Glycoside hydrolase family 16 protein n=1 Tax=Nocardioides bruguierae TaxID=2945102 RepID=A0A9X2D8V2_9ACTN|nr:glycoside hydrolase family 16 protein [Nocardioides bruguierae]MCM0621495.1 glycoside hydrolase family 16 protein [Nocardioides bruguierae]